MEKYIFCNACGSPNPDGSAFCSACGKPLAAPIKLQQTAELVGQPNSFTQPTNTETAFTFQDCFRRDWRLFASSALSLTMIIIYSISFLITLYNALNLAHNMHDEWLKLCVVMGIIPTILTAVGLWLTYGDAAGMSKRPIRMAGLTMIKCVQILRLVCFCIIAAIVLIAAYLSLHRQDGIKAEGMLLLFLIFGVAFTAILLGIRFIDAVREAAEHCAIDSGCAIGLAVFQFIRVVIILIGIIAIPNMQALSYILQCVLSTMFGVLLVKYNRMMENLEQKRRRINNAIATTQYTAEKTPSENWPYPPEI